MQLRWHRGGKLRRRAGAVAAVLFAVVVGGCGGSSSGTDSASSVKLQNTFGAAHGDVASATWALPYGEPNTIDPANGAYYSSSFVTSQMCDPLLRTNPDYTISPDLATEKRVNPLTVVFDLHHGVRFWDGNEMTSADVVYSLRHAFSPNSAIGAIFDSVKSVVPTGRFQVTVHFKVPDEKFTKEVAGFSSAVYEKKAAIRAGSKFGTAQGGIMCSGPYELQKWTPGSDIVLVANPHYWDPSRAAHIKTVTIRFATNSTTLAEDLVAGSVDGAYEIPAETIPRLSKASSGQLLYGPANLYLTLDALRPSGPMGDVRLRKALFTSIDRPALARIVFHGAATPNYTQLNTGVWDPEALDQYKAAYKPYEKAGKTWGTPKAIAAGKKLVAASGYKGQPIVLATLAGDATLNEVAQLIQQQAKAVGLNVTIKPLTSIQFSNAFTSAKDRQGLDLAVDASFNGARDPLEPLQFEVLPDSYYNYLHYDNPEVQRLIGQANQTFDPHTRADLVIKAQKIYEKNWNYATLLNLDEISFLNKGLSGMVTSFPYMFSPTFWSIGAAK